MPVHVTCTEHEPGFQFKKQYCQTSLDTFSITMHMSNYQVEMKTDDKITEEEEENSAMKDAAVKEGDTEKQHDVAESQMEEKEEKHDVAESQKEEKEENHDVAESQKEEKEEKHDVAEAQKEEKEEKHDVAESQKEEKEEKAEPADEEAEQARILRLPTLELGGDVVEVIGSDTESQVPPGPPIQLPESFGIALQSALPEAQNLLLI